MKMHGVIREVMFYAVFLYLLMMVAYCNRDSRSSDVYNTVWGTFLQCSSETATRPDGSDWSSREVLTAGPLAKITSKEQLWRWLSLSLVPRLYPDVVVFDTSLNNSDRVALVQGELKPFTVEPNSMLVGRPRLRQLRVHNDSCDVTREFRGHVHGCRDTYGPIEQESDDYAPGWQSSNSSNSSSGSATPWTYRKASELDGWPYWAMMSVYNGGGYLAELGPDANSSLGTLSDLKEHDWLDPLTRGLFLEFVLFHPNINLFTVCVTVFEFPLTGGVVPSPRLFVMRLDRYVGSFMPVVMGAEIIVACFIVFFSVREMRLFCKQRKGYFADFWNWVEMIIVAMAWVAIVMFFYRLLLSNQLTAQYRKNKERFLNFQYVTMWEELYQLFLSWIIFLSTLKFMRLLRFNSRMSMLWQTLSMAARPMASFMIVFFIVFLAFAMMMFGILSPNNGEFASFAGTISTLFSMMLNKFNFAALQSSCPLIGPAVFVLFTLLVSFVLVNMFLTIIIEAFQRVKHDVSLQQNEYEIIEFMVMRMKAMLGMGNRKAQVQPISQGYVSDEIDLDDAYLHRLLKRMDLLVDTLHKECPELEEEDLPVAAESKKRRIVFA